jgi:hypothetical protein
MGSEQTQPINFIASRAQEYKMKQEKKSPSKLDLTLW